MMQNLTTEMVAGRIYSLPGRPPFMIADDLAEFYQVSRKRLMEQVRRHPGRFPEGYIFEMTSEELRSKLPQFAATSQGRRTDLKHYGFTEKGAYIVAGILSGPVADEVSVMIIDAFFAMRDALLATSKFFAFKNLVEAMKVKRFRLVIEGVRAGASFKDIWLADGVNISRPKLALTAHECLANGWIDRLPPGTPALDLEQNSPEAAPAPQLDLFAKEG